MAAICMLGILIKEYLLDLKMKGSSPHTVENYGFHLDKFANFLEWNKLNFSELTAKQAKLFRNHLVDEGLQSRTVNSILAAVKSFL
jgi:integrase/recombinase XerC/integrase/recombinase XerD